jgi:hypothetical protein
METLTATSTLFLIPAVLLVLAVLLSLAGFVLELVSE